MDETRNGLAAGFVSSRDVARLRTEMREMRLPRQQRVHFVKESEPRRRRIIAAMVELGIEVTIYTVDRPRSSKAAREDCMAALVADLADTRTSRLVIERHDPALGRDRQLLFDLVRKHGLIEMAYVHLRGREDPLLWVPDAVGWCWGRGGPWRRRIEPLLRDVRKL